MNAYEKSLKLQLTGTDAEKAAVLSALGAKDIPVSKVATWMREQGLWIQGIALRGSLYDLYQSTDNEEIKAGLDEWHASTLSGQAETVRLTNPDTAAKVAKIIGLISALIPNGPASAAQLYELAGGRPWADCTADQLAEQRAAAEAAESRKVDVKWWINLHNAILPGLADGTLTREQAVALVVAELTE